MATSNKKIQLNSNLLFAAFSVLLIFAVFFWLEQNDFMPAHTGDTKYFTLAYDYFHLIQENIKNLLVYSIKIDNVKPPLLVYLLTTIIFIFNGANHDLIFLSSILFLNVFFLVSLYFFCKYAFENNFESNSLIRNFTLILYVLSPLLFGLTKLSYVELILLDMFLLNITLIKKWENNLSIKKALILGVTTGLGFLTKSTFGFYILFPLLYIAYKTINILIEKNKNERLIKSVLKEQEKGHFNRYISKEFCKYLASFLLGFFICVPWYVFNIKRVFNLFGVAADYELHTDGPVWSIHTILNYAFDLIQAFGLFSFLAFLVILIVKFDELRSLLPKGFRKELSKKPLETILDNYYICFALVPTLTFLAYFFVSNKNERFQALSLFIFILLFATLYSKIQKKTFLNLTVIILLLLQALYSFQLAFVRFIPWLPDTNVMYVSRPYAKLFSDELAKKIQTFTKLDRVNLIDLRKQSKEDMIFSHKQRTVLASNVRFALFKAQHGLLAKQDKNVSSTHRMATLDIMRSRKEYLLALFDGTQDIAPQLEFKPESLTELIGAAKVKRLLPIKYFAISAFTLENTPGVIFALYSENSI